VINSYAREIPTSQWANIQVGNQFRSTLLACTSHPPSMDNKMDSSSTPPPPPPPTSSKITPCCYSYNTNSRRGICNVSKVSCHISCAIQILCHAIPTVHFTLLRIAVEEEERIRKEGKTFHQDLDSFPSSSSSLSSSSSASWSSFYYCTCLPYCLLLPHRTWLLVSWYCYERYQGGSVRRVIWFWNTVCVWKT